MKKRKRIRIKIKIRKKKKIPEMNKGSRMARLRAYFSHARAIQTYRFLWRTAKQRSTGPMPEVCIHPRNFTFWGHQTYSSMTEGYGHISATPEPYKLTSSCGELPNRDPQAPRQRFASRTRIWLVYPNRKTILCKVENANGDLFNMLSL